MDEPERFKRDSMKHAKIPYRLIIKRYWVGLLAVSASWFLYDFIVYPVCSLSFHPLVFILTFSFIPVRFVLYNRRKQYHWWK